MKEKIINVIRNQTYPIRARHIARLLGIDRTTVNQVLYANLNNPFIRNDKYEWSLNDSKFNQVSNRNHFMFALLSQRWHYLIEYILEIYETEPNFFDFGEVNYTLVNKSDQIIVEIEVYLMHLLLHIQYYDQPDYIDDEDIIELMNQLKQSLRFDYSNNTFTINYLKSKFEVEDQFITKFLYSMLRYDDVLESRKTYIIIEKIRNIAFYIYMVNDNNNSIIKCIDEVINDLKDYVAENYNYSDGEQDSFAKCDDCMKWVLKKYANMSQESIYQCDDCFCDNMKFEENFENDDNLGSELDEDIDSEEAFKVDDNKEEIIESCSTCHFKKDRSCINAHLNIICEKYKYRQ